MSYIMINGVPIPDPKRGARIITSTVVNAGRNTNGVTVGQVVGGNLTKIDGFEIPWLSAEEWSEVLALFDNFYVIMTYFDQRTNAERSIRVYPGDRSAEPYWIDENGKPIFYRHCKVNFIATGE